MQPLMYVLILIVTTACGCLGADGGQLEAGEPVRVRVLSYNIHHGRGVDGKIDLQRIAKIIRDARPDIVALQECDRKTRRSQGVDQPAELARLTDMHVLFEPNIAFQGGQYGNAVLSRRKAVRHVNHRLPSLTVGEQRGMLDVTFDLHDDGPRIRFLTTHLDYRRDDSERLESCKMIEKLTAAQPDQPMILAGDLNALWDSRVMDRLRSQWMTTRNKPIFTFPAGGPKRQIDYILYRPADRWKSVSTQVVEAPVASDHRPLLAELELLIP